MSQDVCAWNQRFARELPEGSPFAPREFIARKDARQLAHDLLELSQEEFSAAFKGSPMKRAKLAGLKRSATVVLGNRIKACRQPLQLIRAPSQRCGKRAPLRRDLPT